MQHAPTQTAALGATLISIVQAHFIPLLSTCDLQVEGTFSAIH